jgi:hypothetical protein
MALLNPMDAEQGWQTLSTPTMHQWDKPGTVLSGKLLAVDQIQVKGKPVHQYVLDTGVKGERIKFLATYDLAQKLTLAHRGMLVRIKYLGEDPTVKKGDNSMKVFDVQVKPDPNDSGPPDRDTGPDF